MAKNLAKYLKDSVDNKRGGGECAHLATAMLQANGYDFTRTESIGTKNYAWSSDLIVEFTTGKTSTRKKFVVGDIIQFHNAVFSAGASAKLMHHTQVVGEVDSQGRITKVYEQNYNSIRKVRLTTPKDISKLTGGFVTIYRPVSRYSTPGFIEYTIVNKTLQDRTYKSKIGDSNSDTSLTSYDTAHSYKSRSMKFHGSVIPTIGIGSSTVKVKDGSAYEIYLKSDGKVAIRLL